MFAISHCNLINFWCSCKGAQTDMIHTWYQGWQVQNEMRNWEVSAEEFCRRSGELSRKDVTEEFNKLIQDASIIAYQERFEVLRSTMPRSNPTFFLWNRRV